MIGKKTLKYIKSLQLKKYRKAEQCFLVEGAKSVLELLASDYKIRTVFATSVFLNQQKQFLSRKNITIVEVSEEALAAAGTYKTNNAAIALVEMKENAPLKIEGAFSLVLDQVKDPGNLGTIIRIADWYGIKNIICSLDCADRYNPKVIAASMGSFTRINLFYTDLETYLEKCNMTVYGAYLNGENIHHCAFKKEGLLLMGNES